MAHLLPHTHTQTNHGAPAAHRDYYIRTGGGGCFRTKTPYLLQSADQHRPPTMGKFNMFRSPLEASLTILKQLLRQDVLQQSPAQAADLYRAAIHLLGALKEDQVLLYRIQCVGFRIPFAGGNEKKELLCNNFLNLTSTSPFRHVHNLISHQTRT